MQVVDFADPKNEEVQPWLEIAYLEGARALHKSGNTERAKKVQDDYTRAFPDGKYKSEILNLDGGAAPAPKKAPPAEEGGSPSE
jgi:hypothetical protein